MKYDKWTRVYLINGNTFDFPPVAFDLIEEAIEEKKESLKMVGLFGLPCIIRLSEVVICTQKTTKELEEIWQDSKEWEEHYNKFNPPNFKGDFDA